MIDQATIDRIIDAANIADVVSDFVTLRKRGVNFVGLCPFHTDKSPSFYVSPAKNICKCFACGEGGTSVHFIMKHEQLSYFDALRFLAKKYNIEIQERELSDEEKQQRGDRESMLIVNSFAQQYFSTQLHEHMEGKNIGLRYFMERGFREDIIRKFQLGYSLDQRDALFQAATKAGYKKDYLEKTGLIVVRDDGSTYDRFRGRVIFPVHTLSGKVVAFGGRVLKKDEKTAKYMNSPESEIYHKSNELYGIFFAKQAMVKADRCFLVEGYTDVISMHQAGIENVVASSGTALTMGQIRLIHRFTENITVLYDGDAAGIKAALRGIDLLLEEGLNIKVVLLPEGEDPDSFARKQNAASFGEFIKKSETDFIQFKTNLLLQDAGGDPIKRSALISDIIRSIAIIPGDVARSVYVRDCSSRLDIGENILFNEINKIRIEKQEKRPVSPPMPQGMQGMPDMPPLLPPDFPEYPAQPDYQSAGMLPQDMPPPPPDEYDEAAGIHRPSPAFQAAMPPSAPYKRYEYALIRYVVRYGELILFDYLDEETNTQITLRVAEFIKYDLERDDLSFKEDVYRQMLDEAVLHNKDAGFVSSRYFLAHPNQNISRLAADLLTEKYQLSKYHSKYRQLEQEEDRLPQIVQYDSYILKDAYIQENIKHVQSQIKQEQTSGDMDKIEPLLKELMHLNEIKNALAKELGERIVLR